MRQGWKVVESGVDWLSASCSIHKLHEGQSLERFAVRSDELLRAEESRGCKRVRWTNHGFTGWTCGQVGAAVHGSTAIVRLSGHCAAERWRDFVEDSTNVSRLDLAVTARNDAEWTDVTREHLNQVRDHAKLHNPRLRVTRIDGGKHGNTLTIGSRSSDAYLRVYDKERESKREEYRDCWRYELELKRKLANGAAANLYNSEEPCTDVCSTVSMWGLMRACVVPWGSEVQELSLIPVVRSGGAEDTVRWLRMCVRASVQRAVASGKRFEVLSALGLYDEPEE